MLIDATAEQVMRTGRLPEGCPPFGLHIGADLLVTLAAGDHGYQIRLTPAEAFVAACELLRQVERQCELTAMPAAGSA